MILENSDWRFLKYALTTDNIIKDVYNSREENDKEFSGNQYDDYFVPEIENKTSDKITTIRNIWNCYKQDIVDKEYKKNITTEDIKEAVIEAELWTGFLEHCHNRQYKNNVINGGN